MKDEFNIWIIDNQKNCIICGDFKRPGSFYCGRCGSFFAHAKTDDEREGLE